MATRKDDRVVVWAHNNHVGDARSVEPQINNRRKLNMFQLIKENYPNECINIGQFTCNGNIFATDSWGGDYKTFVLKDCLPNSWESLFKQVHKEINNNVFALDFRRQKLRNAIIKLVGPRLERTIGAVYEWCNESETDYSLTNLANQFDICISYEFTTEIIPLVNEFDICKCIP